MANDTNTEALRFRITKASAMQVGSFFGKDWSANAEAARLMVIPDDGLRDLRRVAQGNPEAFRDRYVVIDAIGKDLSATEISEMVERWQGIQGAIGSQEAERHLLIVANGIPISEEVRTSATVLENPAVVAAAEAARINQGIFVDEVVDASMTSACLPKLTAERYIGDPGARVWGYEPGDPSTLNSLEDYIMVPVVLIMMSHNLSSQASQQRFCRTSIGYDLRGLPQIDCHEEDHFILLGLEDSISDIKDFFEIPSSACPTMSHGRLASPRGFPRLKTFVVRKEGLPEECAMMIQALLDCTPHPKVKEGIQKFPWVAAFASQDLQAIEGPPQGIKLDMWIRHNASDSSSPATYATHPQGIMYLLICAIRESGICPDGLAAADLVNPVRRVHFKRRIGWHDVRAWVSPEMWMALKHKDNKRILEPFARNFWMRGHSEFVSLATAVETRARAIEQETRACSRLVATGWDSTQHPSAVKDEVLRLVKEASNNETANSVIEDPLFEVVPSTATVAGFAGEGKTFIIRLPQVTDDLQRALCGPRGLSGGRSYEIFAWEHMEKRSSVISGLNGRQFEKHTFHRRVETIPITDVTQSAQFATLPENNQETLKNQQDALWRLIGLLPTLHPPPSAAAVVRSGASSSASRAPGQESQLRGRSSDGNARGGTAPYVRGAFSQRRGSPR
jgi:hypothetical protein